MDRVHAFLGSKGAKFRRGAIRIAVTVLGGLSVAPVFAQTAATPDDATLSEVLVTATRITRAGFEAPTPTTVLTAEDIEKSAPANIADYVNTLPQMNASSTPQSTYINIAGGLGGANVLNLRGLGTVRTLSLMDGRRIVGAGPTGVVDVNLIPSALVSRVDVVTGGASAAWGSDAVGGVVNFVLDTKFTGFKGEVQGGTSSYHDADNQKVSLTYGTDFAGSKGHVIVSGLYSKVDEARTVNSRPWYTATKFVPNPTWAAGNGQPYFLVLPGIGLSSATDGGLITAVAGGAPASLVGTNFTSATTTSRFVFGTPLTTALQLGGTYQDIAGRLPLLASVQQRQVYLRSSYEVTDSITAFVEGQYGRSYTPYHGVMGGQATGLTLPAITIRPDNAYLPAAIATQMPAGSSFTLGRLNMEFGLTDPVNTRNTYRAVAGLDGKLRGDWKWSAYYQNGRTTVDNDVYNDPILARFPLAADAVVVTAANVGSSGLPVGSIACRSTLTAPTNGCVPENVFGFGSPTAAAQNYLMGHAHQHIVLKEQVGSAQISGSAFNAWGGPVAVAAGVETRTEQMVGDSDPLAQATSFQNGNAQPLSGKYSVNEGFLEADVPLVKDAPGFKLVDVDAAVRYTNYSVSGSVTTWKVGANWKVNDQFSFRATKSRDIRAPNLNDLFLSATTSRSVVADAQTGGNPSVNVVAQGNLGLRPEVANSYGWGIVYRPSWLSGFAASLDYYSINIADAITTVTAQNTVNNCLLGQAIYCSAITRVNGAITQVLAVPFNAGAQTQKGVDIELSYRTGLSALHLPGQLGIRLLATNFRESTVTTSGVVTDLLGALPQDGPPRWKGTMTAGYVLGASETTLTTRFIGAGVIDNTYTEGGNARLLSVNDNTVSSNVTFDLSETFDLKPITGHNFQIYAVVQNLLDRAPPVAVYNAPGMFARQGVNPDMYDLIGRQYRAGVRFRF